MLTCEISDTDMDMQQLYELEEELYMFLLLDNFGRFSTEFKVSILLFIHFLKKFNNGIFNSILRGLITNIYLIILKMS